MKFVRSSGSWWRKEGSRIPHAIADNGHDCLYMQETWLVTADGGVPLSGLESKIF